MQNSSSEIAFTYTKELVLNGMTLLCQNEKMLLVIPLILTSFSAFADVSPKPATQAPILSEVFASRKAKEIPFYKSKASIFPSGYTTFERLNEQLVSAEASDVYYLFRDGKKISPAAVSHLTVFHLSRVWIEKYTKRRVKPNHTLDLATIQLNYDTDAYDRGFVLTLNPTKLRPKPDIKSITKTEIPVLSYFIPIKFEKGFIKVLHKNQFGYIDINDCISKFDFAKFAFSFKSPNSNWDVITRRDFDTLVTAENKMIQLNEVKGLITDQKLAFAYKETSDYAKWSSFRIQKEKAKPWLQSQFSGHGLIWWQKPEVEVLSKNTISIDELIKKDVYSVSFQVHNPKKGLASAHGVYMTEDGQNWTEISQFKGYSGPVYYHNDAIMFVGNYRSFDGGKTFEHYIQIDKVAEAVKKHLGSAPKKIQITKIKVQQPYSLLIDVNAAGRKVRLKSPLFAQDWKSIKF